MLVYMYQAALLCEECGEKTRDELTEAGKAPSDVDDETSYDSDNFPKGPFEDGGGESDTPAHCDACQAFLENPLTSEGEAYVIEAVREAYRSRGSKYDKSVAIDEWEPFYDLDYWPKGLLTIKIDTSDEDPFRSTAYVQDPLADAWCDAQGSLDGGTWECADGPDFCYDILYWRPGLIDELIAEGYDLDLSEYSEPEEEEIAIAKHASECDACEYDYARAEKHFDPSTGQLRIEGV